MLPKNRRIEREIYPKTRPVKSIRGQFASISIFPFDGKISRKTKFSFSISKKIAKTAVLRNKIRRIGYKTIAANLNKIRDGFLVRFSVYSVPPPLQELTKELNRDIENLLAKADIIKNNKQK